MWGGRKKIQKKRMKSLRTIQRHLLFSWYTYMKHQTKLKQTKKGKGEVPTSQSKLYITEMLLLFPIIGFRNVYVLWMIAKPELFSITIQLKEKKWYVLTAVTIDMFWLQLQTQMSWHGTRDFTLQWMQHMVCKLINYMIFNHQYFYNWFFFSWIKVYNGFLMELQGWSIYIMVASHL